ncbi:SPFH domain-containing protein [Cellulomonas sp. KRMCY2]|uniref:SPFH domain-containing protein n=1 Tax=Cellulomonas sp. KRMCY2 TaxID=1304865 RepID=UPI00045E8FC4|nr:SPFH domain-containing protein [Cellulomonas sp. KRMCY2]
MTSIVERDPTPAGRPVGHSGVEVDIRERPAWQANGFVGVGAALLLAGLGTWALIRADADGTALMAVLGTLAYLAMVVIAGSLAIVQPGRTNVVQFFGRYVGTVRRAGLIWVIPLSTRKSLSVRVRNFETARMKVNDSTGNPVEIAAIVVWQVADTAKATFAVEAYGEFIAVQAESAVRHVAGTYPYDGADGERSLRGSTDQVSLELAHEVAERVALAGLEIVEVRISHLAYAPEIAQAMLQRQQASAVIAARSRIVEGAVGMVQMALEQLAAQGVVVLDEERKAAMVSNLLVVLCGDSRATPVVNTGTLYQ